MARGTLHAPKPNAARRNAPTHSEHVVVADGQTRGPAFPASAVTDPHPLTLEWWETWRAAPQAQLFEGTDWARLSMLARGVDYYFKAPKPPAAMLSEIRMNEERLGATVTDRLRGRIRIEQAEDATVTPLHSVPAGPSIADRLKR